MQIDYAKTKLDEVRALENEIEEEASNFCWQQRIEKLNNGEFTFAVQMCVALVAEIIMMSSLNNLDISFAAFFIINAAVGLIALLMTYEFLQLVKGLIRESGWYQKYKVWCHFMDVIKGAREASEAQKFLQQSKLKAIRVEDGVCKLEVYCNDEADDVTLVHSNSGIPQSSIRKLVSSGVLDLTCIDEVVGGVRRLRQ